MRQEDLCPGRADSVEVPYKKRLNKMPKSIFSLYDNPHASKGIKRIKMKCEICGRRVTSSIINCDDGCCVRHVIPPHRPKK